MPDTFPYRPICFLSNPNSYEDIQATLDRFLFFYYQEDACHTASARDPDLRIPLSDILYFESSAHRVIIHRDGNQEPVYPIRLLDEIDLELHEYGFVRTHQSFPVRWEAIARVDRKNMRAVLTDGRNLPIRRSCYAAVMEQFIRHRLMRASFVYRCPMVCLSAHRFCHPVHLFFSGGFAAGTARWRKPLLTPGLSTLMTAASPFLIGVYRLSLYTTLYLLVPLAIYRGSVAQRLLAFALWMVIYPCAESLTMPDAPLWGWQPSAATFIDPLIVDAGGSVITFLFYTAMRGIRKLIPQRPDSRLPAVWT